jgi:hypothetical protein
MTDPVHQLLTGGGPKSEDTGISAVTAASPSLQDILTGGHSRLTDQYYRNTSTIAGLTGTNDTTVSPLGVHGDWNHSLPTTVSIHIKLTTLTSLNAVDQTMEGAQTPAHLLTDHDMLPQLVSSTSPLFIYWAVMGSILTAAILAMILLRCYIGRPFSSLKYRKIVGKEYRTNQQYTYRELKEGGQEVATSEQYRYRKLDEHIKVETNDFDNNTYVGISQPLLWDVTIV